jgi:hypothetical protein
MPVLHDLFQEFHNASPGEKTLLVVAVIAVAGLGLYVYKNSQNNSSQGTLVPIGSSDNSSNGSGTTPPPPPPPGTTPPPPTLKNPIAVITGGELATKPGGTNNGGSNLFFLNPGALVQLLSGAVRFNGTNYYQVATIRNGQVIQGYVRGSTIGRS